MKVPHDMVVKEYGLTHGEISMCRNAHKIDAIKSLRDRTGLRLGSAKALVDAFIFSDDTCQSKGMYPSSTTSYRR